MVKSRQTRSSKLLFNYLGNECRLTAQPNAEQDQKSRVVSGPLIFSLFPVLEVSVHSLRRGKQVKHLPQGEFKVHLSEMKQPPQVLVALRTRCVPCSVPGTEGTVAVWRRGGQHGAENEIRRCEVQLLFGRVHRAHRS